jgi:hypothetical protein
VSPGVRFRLVVSFMEAAQREPLGSPMRARFKTLAGLTGYGAGMPALASTLYRLTSP